MLKRANSLIHILICLACLCRSPLALSAETAKEESIEKPAASPTKPVKDTSKHAFIELKKQTPVIAPLEPKETPKETAKEPKKAPDFKKPEEAAASTAMALDHLEALMFGGASAGISAEARLARLEEAVFQKRYTNLPEAERIKQLNDVLVGSGGGGYMPPSPNIPNSVDELKTEIEEDVNGKRGAEKAESPPVEKNEHLFERLANLSEKQQSEELNQTQLNQFVLELINKERTFQGFPALALDDIAKKMAETHIHDLTKRNVVSHMNSVMENPDVRYTKLGGNDAVTESVISLKEANQTKLTKGAVIKALDALIVRQDDREALMSPNSSHLGVAMSATEDKQRLLGCFEIVTRHAFIEPIAQNISVGDKLEIKGVILHPYRFYRLSIAWEGTGSKDEQLEEIDDALPYFPPLDYESYAKKSEHDWDKPMRIMQTVGIGLALAGGVFMPPVALAAPLIAMSASNPKPKAVSDIPVRGGVKVEGPTFTYKVPVSKTGKEGLYYITVWATSGMNNNPIAISRRVVFASADHVEEDSNEKKIDKPKKEKKPKKAKA